MEVLLYILFFIAFISYIIFFVIYIKTTKELKKQIEKHNNFISKELQDFYRK